MYRTIVFALILCLFVRAQGQTQLPGSLIAKYRDRLPALHITAATSIALSMEETLSPVMPTGFVPATGTYQGTCVWRYRDLAGQTETSYIGPVVLATRGVPTAIRFRNDLPATGAASNLAFWSASVDQTIHWADPLQTGHTMNQYFGPIPAVPHLHGGELPPQLDGGPEAWFTSDGLLHGSAYYSSAGAAGNEAIYRYPNVQEAAPLWFHDHALGATRLNVYAGLAAAYLLADPAQALPAGLTPYGIGTETIVPVVIQDRTFDVNGQLFFDHDGVNPGLHPFWVPEFIGDTIVVNGKVWPTFGTAAAPMPSKRYRFLFLNGSNARTYELFLEDPATGRAGPPMWVIGTDGGYLDRPVRIDPATGSPDRRKLLIMPGERYDVIVDFNDAVWRAANHRFSGTLLLRNTANAPYPGGDPVDPATTGQIMKFFIGAPVPDTGYDPASGTPLRAPMVRLADPVAGTAVVTPALRRQLTLNEVMGPDDPAMVLVNNTMWDGMSVATDVFPGGMRPDFLPDPLGRPDSLYSEQLGEGLVEEWDIVNMTEDAHPIHLHLAQFQLVNRQDYRTARYEAAYAALFPGTTAPDPASGLPYPPGTIIGGFGPPLPYANGNPLALGGNPDIGPYLVGPPRPPRPYEVGWKDTIMAEPGKVTRLMVRWAPTHLATGAPAASLCYPFDPLGTGATIRGFVWHCHIIDHEDNEMMRPDFVRRNPQAPAVRALRQGVDY
jgi:spore coat protein A